MVTGPQPRVRSGPETARPFIKGLFNSICFQLPPRQYILPHRLPVHSSVSPVRVRATLGCRPGCRRSREVFERAGPTLPSFLIQCHLHVAGYRHSSQGLSQAHVIASPAQPSSELATFLRPMAKMRVPKYFLL